MKIRNYLSVYPILFLAFIFATSCQEDFSDIVIPEVTTGFASSITDTSALIEGNTNTSGGDHIVLRGVCWSNLLTVPSSNPDDWYNGGWGSGSFTGYLSGLTPGTTYYVQAYSSNSAGMSTGNTIIFSTTGNMLGAGVFHSGLTYGTLTDIEGNNYKTIQIGDQVWMAENLRTTQYSDGSDIPEVTGLNAWIDLETPGFCWYVNDGKYKNPFGALYNWYTVNTEKLCPAGWHVPGDAEWITLTENLGDEAEIIAHLRETGKAHWVIEAQEDNSTGFTALPGGLRSWNDNKYFRGMGYEAAFWSSTADPFDAEDFSISRKLICHPDSVRFIYEVLNKKTGLSVRCVQD